MSQGPMKTLEENINGIIVAWDGEFSPDYTPELRRAVACARMAPEMFCCLQEAQNLINVNSRRKAEWSLCVKKILATISEAA